MSNDIKNHYESLLDKHGDSSQAVQYSDKSSHFKRFEILSQISPDLNSVLDVGCGLAHFLEFLINTKDYTGTYMGVDFVDKFIETNSLKYPDDKNIIFRKLDILTGDLPAGYDYAFLSGVFNNKMDNNRDFLYSTVNKMFQAADKGIAFNAMSTYVDYQDDHLYYVDPLEVFDFCKRNLTRKVVLRHEYTVKDGSIPFEFSIFLYK